MRAACETWVRELKDKRDRLSGRLQELKGSGNSAWTALQAGVAVATRDLADAIASAKDKYAKAAQQRSVPEGRLRESGTEDAVPRKEECESPGGRRAAPGQMRLLLTDWSRP